MSFPRYPAYKDSGVEWLGEVPEHWGVERFKLSVESCVNGVWGEEPGKGENDVTCIRVSRLPNFLRGRRCDPLDMGTPKSPCVAVSSQ
jgi:hypothetical protein